ncbi:MAG TPA: disulfide oxidoreductase [Pyrinomonadaceae bacterium]|nr:disulfide oxidoreductase [Pyrinomonadaceae bacterium]
MKKAEQSSAKLTSSFNELLPYAAWSLAVLSAAGSLFFSEVMDLQPCVLCWYQRIAMYPLVLIIGIGIVTKDVRWKTYALPLALIGLVISVYHNLVYYGVIPESLTPCTQGVSCSERQIEWFGFLTIPLMGLLSFLVITLTVALFKTKKEV